MGLIACAGISASLLAIASGFAVYAICKWLRRPDIGKRYGVITGIVWYIAWMWVLFPTLMWATTTVEIGISGPKADALLAVLRVPPGQATDLCFRRTYNYCFADFNMTEPDFLSWLKSRDFKPSRFKNSQEWDVTSVRDWGTDKELSVVTNGYYYSEQRCEKAECFWKVVYDLDHHRVYIED